MKLAANETVRQIAIEIPGATREFEKLGIDYCCGGSRSLGEACAAISLPVDEVLSRLQYRQTACNHVTSKDWQGELLADLIDHIKATHHVFVREECPHIEALAGKVAEVHGKSHPALQQVQQVFAALAEELHVHLMKEEHILFPYISRMEESARAGELPPPSCFGTVTNPIRMMVQEHDGAGEALRSLRTVTSDYKVPEDACVSYRTLYEALQGFEADLHQHIHLENNVLFPRAIAMETEKTVATS